MIGLYGCYSKQIQIAQDSVKFAHDSLKINEMKNMGRGFAGRNTLNQFLNDKVFFEDEELMIGCEGIVFNSNVLKKQSSVNSMFDLIKKNFKASVKSFPSSMRAARSHRNLRASRPTYAQGSGPAHWGRLPDTPLRKSLSRRQLQTTHLAVPSR